MGNLAAEVIPTLTWPWSTIVPVSACPTQIEGSPAKTLPTQMAARASISGLGPVSLYSDTTETTEVLASSG